ncbi:Rhodanese-like domain-containing protein [Entophlyctis helioformis]|nr:Rhodanese-like domain-containing protein [Entophlyctis helioformis]
MFARRIFKTASQAALRAPAATVAFRSLSATPAARGLFADYLKTVAPSVKEITAAQLNARITADPVHGPPSSLHILDVRETYEWNEEHIPFAVYTGRGTLERDIESTVVDQFDDVVVYCAGGARSILAADALQKMGYKNVYSLKGGIGAWKQSSLPIVANEKTYTEKIDY